jgi:hypothetical protein
MINRRFMIVPPALPSGGHAEQLEQTSKEFPCLLLEMANMRVHRFHETDQLREIPFVPPDVVGADPLCSTDEHHGSATEGGGDRDW